MLKIKPRNHKPRCVYCHGTEDIESTADEIVECEGCKATMHVACRAESGKCATIGCSWSEPGKVQNPGDNVNWEVLLGGRMTARRPVGVPGHCRVCYWWRSDLDPTTHYCVRCSQLGVEDMERLAGRGRRRREESWLKKTIDTAHDLAVPVLIVGVVVGFVVLIALVVGT